MANSSTTVDFIKDLPRGNDFSQRIDYAIQKSRVIERPFFVMLIQLENMESFTKKHPRYVTLNLYKEIFQTFRKVVHPTQFVGSFQNGFGFVFDRVDVGSVDTIAKQSLALCAKVIREGRYNDMTGRWTEIIAQFLLPQKPIVIHPRAGWAIYPRDGANPTLLVKRALYHMKELNR